MNSERVVIFSVSFGIISGVSRRKKILGLSSRSCMPTWVNS